MNTSILKIQEKILEKAIYKNNKYVFSLLSKVRTYKKLTTMFIYIKEKKRKRKKERYKKFTYMRSYLKNFATNKKYIYINNK